MLWKFSTDKKMKNCVVTVDIELENYGLRNLTNFLVEKGGANWREGLTERGLKENLR